MGNNSFGNIFRITTWGESHGPAIGVVIDGCPAGLDLSEQDLIPDLQRRAPGSSPYTSPRKESDKPQILSGIFESKTTGAPISIVIYNVDARSKSYDPIQQLLRPGHANFTYLQKYGIFDPRGGGRASARETTCRVAAGGVAKKLLAHFKISIQAYIRQIGSIKAAELSDLSLSYSNAVYCPDQKASLQMVAEIERVITEGNSLGGVVEFVASGVPVGLGDPVYEKLSANLSKAMLSIPATKGFELGSGFEAVFMQGSTHNDLYEKSDEKIKTRTNHSGGILGGISNGMPIVGRVAFKPPSSIKQPQSTLTTAGESAILQYPEGSRHDPCVAIRAVPVVEAMAALVLADAMLMNRCSKL
jgi:chorismate synthase